MRAIFCFILVILNFNLAVAEDDKITIKNSWVRLIDNNLRITNLYMDIINESPKEDYLLEVHSDIAPNIFIHKTVVENNISQSVPISVLAIPGNSTVKLEPGKINVVIEDPKVYFKKEDKIEFVLIFKHAGSKKVIAEVR